MGLITAVVAQILTGLVVLFVSFSVLAGISPDEVAGLAAAAAATGAVLVIRALRIDYEIRSRSGDPQLREGRNRQRERRGF